MGGAESRNEIRVVTFCHDSMSRDQCWSASRQLTVSKVIVGTVTGLRESLSERKPSPNTVHIEA